MTDPTTPAEREALREMAESVATRGPWPGQRPFVRVTAHYPDDRNYVSAAAPQLILRLLSDLAAAEHLAQVRLRHLEAAVERCGGANEALAAAEAQIAEAKREAFDAGYNAGENDQCTRDWGHRGKGADRAFAEWVEECSAASGGRDGER